MTFRASLSVMSKDMHVRHSIHDVNAANGCTVALKA